jgi:hypothetical protein
MKGNLLLFPFISFSESGLFNGLQSIQIKKISFHLNSRSRLQAERVKRRATSVAPIGNRQATAD